MKKVIANILIIIGNILPENIRHMFKNIMLKTFRYLPEGTKGTVSFCKNKYELRNLNKSYFSFQLFCEGAESSEPETVLHLEELMSEYNFFLDIGANIGQYAMYITSVSPNAKVHCFEPNEKVFDFLKQNIEKNNLEKNIHLHQIALGDEKGTAELNIPESLMSSSLRSGWRSAKHTSIVEVNTLDDFCKEHDIKESSLIKIDVEGFEEQVLNGGKEYLTNHRPDLIIEILNEFDDNLEKFLADLGYKFYHITPFGFKEKDRIIKGQNTGEKYLYMNYFFSTKEKHHFSQLYQHNSHKIKRLPLDKIYKLTADCD